MPTYQLASGEEIEYATPAPELASFMDRVRAAANDPAITPSDMITLVYGTDNPLLDTISIPGRAIIRRAALEHPVYLILGDLLFRKQLAASSHTVQDVAATHTVSVKEAARQLGITESSVRAAITGRKLAAWMRNGQWYLRPESVASYKVSNRGRKKTRRSRSAKSVTRLSGKAKATKKPVAKKSVSHR